MNTKARRVIDHDAGQVIGLSTLIFHAGPHEYQLVITDRRMYDREGYELQGLAMEGPRLVLISGCMPVSKREEIAHHELLHCWEFHVPAPRNAEERCQLFATVSVQFQKDLNAQGGLEALLRLRPQKMPELGNPLTAPDRQCAKAIDDARRAIAQLEYLIGTLVEHRDRAPCERAGVRA